MDRFQALFIVWQGAGLNASDADCRALAEAARSLDGLRRALAFKPLEVNSNHPFAADGRGPPLALEFAFETSSAADQATGASSPLQSALRELAVGRGRLGSQRMIGRDFAVADPVFRLAPGQSPCTFLVDYPGTTDDLPAWLDHYDAHHPQIMVRFPGIRAVATFRPAPAARNELPGVRLESMQRNKVAFDSADALIHALASPVMEEMRADAARFPPFSPRATHFPMSTFDLLTI